MMMLVRRNAEGLCLLSLEMHLATGHPRLNLRRLRVRGETLQDRCGLIEQKMTLGINRLPPLMDLSRLSGTGNGTRTKSMPIRLFAYWILTSN
jgi:hypothetical protein